jgi:hypothetical protein
VRTSLTIGMSSVALFFSTFCCACFDMAPFSCGGVEMVWVLEAAVFAFCRDKSRCTGFFFILGWAWVARSLLLQDPGGSW